MPLHPRTAPQQDPKKSIFEIDQEPDQETVDGALGFLTSLQPANAKGLIVAGLQMLDGQPIGRSAISGINATQQLKQQTLQNTLLQKRDTRADTQLGINALNARTQATRFGGGGRQTAGENRETDIRRGLELVSKEKSGTITPDEQQELLGIENTHNLIKIDRINGTATRLLDPGSPIDLGQANSGNRKIDRDLKQSKLRDSRALRFDAGLKDLNKALTDRRIPALENAIFEVDSQLLKIARNQGIDPNLLTEVPGVGVTESFLPDFAVQLLSTPEGNALKVRVMNVLGEQLRSNAGLAQTLSEAQRQTVRAGLNPGANDAAFIDAFEVIRRATAQQRLTQEAPFKKRKFEGRNLVEEIRANSNFNRQPTPNQSNGLQIPTNTPEINSQAEYDALPIGATFIDNGILGKKI